MQKIRASSRWLLFLLMAGLLGACGAGANMGSGLPPGARVTVLNRYDCPYYITAWRVRVLDRELWTWSEWEAHDVLAPAYGIVAAHSLQVYSTRRGQFAPAAPVPARVQFVLIAYKPLVLGQVRSQVFDIEFPESGGPRGVTVSETNFEPCLDETGAPSPCQ